MSKNKVISITDMTQKAYDCILQQNYTKKTCQQYWYCGVVPIRRYFKQKGIELYSPKSINDCLTWYQEQFKQGTVYSTKFQTVRRIAAIMEDIAAEKPYRWQPLTPWYITSLSDSYRALLEDYAKQKRIDGYKETTIRSFKPIIKHFLMYTSFLGYEDIRSITLADVDGYIPKLAESYQQIENALYILRGFGTYLYEKGLTEIHLGNAFSVKSPSRKKLHVGFTQEEATSIISSIDRSNICGKRDYAILMLAMHTGLRGIDVLKLTFANIHG